MIEREQLRTTLNSLPKPKEMNTSIKDLCGFEGTRGRPKDCKNNPWRYPENTRPQICYDCVLNPQSSKVSESYLPPAYVKYKQTGKF